MPGIWEANTTLGERTVLGISARSTTTRSSKERITPYHVAIATLVFNVAIVPSVTVEVTGSGKNTVTRGDQSKTRLCAGFDRTEGLQIFHLDSDKPKVIRCNTDTIRDSSTLIFCFRGL